MNASGQRGMALLTVLLLAAVMSILITVMLDDIRFGLRRAGNTQAMAQAQRYALGTEALARERIVRLARAEDAGAMATADWNDRPLVFPIEHGAISARLGDATACFNLNSVVEGAPEQWRRRELGVRQYVALLRALEIPAAQAEAMADSLVDWIDSDQIRSPQGAEDAAYVGRDPGYRTGATLLAEASELRAIEGYPPTVYARIRRYVCALPNADLSPVNVNALQPGDAPILSMLTLGEVDPEAAAKVISARPATGWRDPVAFWRQPELMQAAIDNQVLEQVFLRSRYFDLHAEVEYDGAQVVLSALLEQVATNRVRLVARRWTPDE